MNPEVSSGAIYQMSGSHPAPNDDAGQQRYRGIAATPAGPNAVAAPAESAARHSAPVGDEWDGGLARRLLVAGHRQRPRPRIEIVSGQGQRAAHLAHRGADLRI